MLLTKSHVREVRCKTLLHRVKFSAREIRYTANLYKGCTHGCVYCYAPSLVHDDTTWGSFVDVKINAPATLRRELRECEKAPVFLSSASDPYQPVEAKYMLARRCLEVVREFSFPVVILTRSPLVLRDLELLSELEWVKVGCSISTAGGRFFEPGVPPLERRLETLRKLADAGIETWVSLAPVVPGLMEFEVDDMLANLRGVGVRAVTAGLLRFQGYEASREHFERSTGMDPASLLEAGEMTIAKVKDSVAKAGFRTPGEFFRWDKPRDSIVLDSFIRPIHGGR